MAKKLFAVYLGGKAKGANIELHDIVFLTSSDIDNEGERIKELWFGEESGLHIDAIATVEGVGEYKISIGNRADRNNNLKLFFINFGGTYEGVLGEKHENGFFVAETKGEAIREAKQKLLTHNTGVHLDNLYDVDNCIDVQTNLGEDILIEKISGFQTTIQNIYKKL